MNTYKNRRRDNAPGMGGIDWQDIRVCCGKACWYLFAGGLLVAALVRAHGGGA